VVVCIVLMGGSLFSQNNNMTELKKYKWWLKYETDKVRLEDLKKINTLDLINSDEILCYFQAKPPKEEKAFCFIDDPNENTLIINSSYKRDQKDKIDSERTACIRPKVVLEPTAPGKKLNPCETHLEYITLEKMEKDYYTYKDHTQLIYLKDAGADVSKMKCLFKNQYFLGEWKYNIAIAPDITKDQKLLTIVSMTGNCLSGTIQYYIGELIKENKKPEPAPVVKKKKRFFFF
ncbi:MAG: hypothetical protein NTY22_08755, partial [Proteobacteria bacterium]|nr:hypothetical protein [Pseudomonadota bacterium]